MTSTEIREEVRRLVRKAWLDKIFDDYDHEDLGQINATYSTLSRNQTLGLLSNSDLNTERNKINDSILTLCKQDGWVLKGQPFKTTPSNNQKNSGMNFTFDLNKSVLSTKAIFDTLNAGFNAGEITPDEIKEACQTFSELTGEEVFAEISHSLEKAVKTRVEGTIKAAIATAIGRLNDMKEALLGFFGDKGQKNLETLYEDFLLSPSEETFKLFSEEVSKVFESKAFYSEEIQGRLNALLQERIDKNVMKDFGWMKSQKFLDWRTRVNKWLVAYFVA